MDKHWNNFCTMSIVHFMAFPNTMGGEGPIVETVSKIAEDPFFGAIEIGWIKDAKARVATKAVLEAAHIKVGFGAQSALLLQKLDLNSSDEAERMKAVGQLKASVDEASEVGAQRVAFLSGKDPGDANRPAALDSLIKSVKEICKYGRDKGIGLTCEIFDRSIDKKCLIGPTDYAAKFAKAIREDYPDFGLMYDLSHMPLLFEKVEALGLIKDLLVHIHIGNCVTDPAKPGYGDLHPPFGWPGGSNDVPELINFLQALFNIGYLKDSKKERPWIGFEVKPQNPSQTPEAVIAGAKRVWQEAWSRV